MRRALLTFALLTFVLPAFAALGASPAAAQEGGRATAFVARPADGSPVAREGGWFHFADAAPGSELTAELALRNDGAEALSLRVAAVDATTAQRGGVAYGLSGETAERVGAWVELARDTVELGPGESAVVPFTVRVPGGADPGDHLGGIAVWAPRQGGAGTAREGMAPGVDIETRQVIAVQVGVPGTVTRRLEVTDVRVIARPDGPHLEIGIDNSGGRLEKGAGRVHVDGEAVGGEFTVDTMVPGTQVAYAVAWPGADLSRPHDVRVRITYEGGVAEWDGSVAGDDTVRAALEDWDAPGASGARERPVVLLLLGGLVAALLILLSLVRWWRRRAGELPVARHLDSSRSS